LHDVVRVKKGPGSEQRGLAPFSHKKKRRPSRDAVFVLLATEGCYFFGAAGAGAIGVAGAGAGIAAAGAAAAGAGAAIAMNSWNE